MASITATAPRRCQTRSCSAEVLGPGPLIKCRISKNFTHWPLSYHDPAESPLTVHILLHEHDTAATWGSQRKPTSPERPRLSGGSCLISDTVSTVSCLRSPRRQFAQPVTRRIVGRQRSSEQGVRGFQVRWWEGKGRDHQLWLLRIKTISSKIHRRQTLRMLFRVLILSQSISAGPSSIPLLPDSSKPTSIPSAHETAIRRWSHCFYDPLLILFQASAATQSYRPRSSLLPRVQRMTPAKTSFRPPLGKQPCLDRFVPRSSELPR